MVKILPEPNSPVRTVTQWVDADTAARWLARSIENPRSIRAGWVEQIARDIVSGNWREGAATIKWTGPDEKTDGSVVGDGQHRLSAVVRAQEITDADHAENLAIWHEAKQEDPTFDEAKPEREVIAVQMEVSWNVPRETIDVVDTNKPRLFSDVIHMGTPDIGDVRRLSAVARWTWQWEHGNPLGASSMATPSNVEMAEIFAERSEIFVYALGRGKDLARQRIVAATTGATAYVRFNRIDGERADRFFDGLVSGSNLDSESPILTLRNRLTSVYFGRTKFRRGHNLALFVYAWNAYQEGRPARRINLPKVKLTAESFPVPVA